MLQIRKISHYFVIPLIGLLIVAFVAWGISDVFNTSSPNIIATVGHQKISTDYFRQNYLRRIDDISRQINAPFTHEQARMFGIDQQVLNELMTVATFNELSDMMGLTVSDKMLAERIKSYPVFAGPSGSFDEPTFRRVLRLNKIQEKIFIQEERFGDMRQQILSAIFGSVVFPKNLAEILYKQRHETRDVNYIILQPDTDTKHASTEHANTEHANTEHANTEHVKPSIEALKSFYATSIKSFTEAERRSATVLTLSLETIARSITIAEHDVVKAYESSRDNYKTVEMREVDQLIIPDNIPIERINKHIKEGYSFAEIATSIGVSLENTYLGKVSYDYFIDPEIADIAFRLKAKKMSHIVEGSFGKILLHIRKIYPESVKPLQYIREDIKKRLALEIATEEFFALSEKIEEDYAQEISLESLAQRYNMKTSILNNISREGIQEEGHLSGIINLFPDLVRHIYESDVGEYLPAFKDKNNHYYWIQVDDIKPAYVIPFEKAKNNVIKGWKKKQQAIALENLAKNIVKRGNQGETFQKLAEEQGKTPLTFSNISRSTRNEIFSEKSVMNIFQTNKNKLTWNTTAIGNSLIVMYISQIMMPDINDNLLIFEKYMNKEKQYFNDDILLQLGHSLQSEYGFNINDEALRIQTEKRVR